MLDLVGNHIVGFPTRWLNYVYHLNGDFLVGIVAGIPISMSYIKGLTAKVCPFI